MRHLVRVFSIAGLSLLPLLFGLPVIFMPVHIAFLELIINPVCSIVFEAEAEEGDIMLRPPREQKAPLFSASLIISSILQGICMLCAVGIFFVSLLHMGVPETEVRAATFMALIISSFSLIIIVPSVPLSSPRCCDQTVHSGACSQRQWHYSRRHF